jgi:hypothetical protein
MIIVENGSVRYVDNGSDYLLYDTSGRHEYGFVQFSLCQSPAKHSSQNFKSSAYGLHDTQHNKDFFVQFSTHQSPPEPRSLRVWNSSQGRFVLQSESAVTLG